MVTQNPWIPESSTAFMPVSTPRRATCSDVKTSLPYKLNGTVITNVARIHTMELTSSWLQSIDDLNVPVFILRRSYRRTGVVVADENIGVSRG